MSIFSILEGLQGFSPAIQTLLISCIFFLLLYVITLVAFYPDAARRIEKFVTLWQRQQSNKRIGNEQQEGDK